MGQGAKQFFRDPISTKIDVFPPSDARHVQWMVMDGNDDICDSSVSTASSFEDSVTSDASLSSSDLAEDASSSTSYSSFASASSPPPQISKGPLYELSELMAQLPIKRGLSKHFQGKSQSFTSLSSVRRIQDLAKREAPYRKKIKPCKSYAGGLDTDKSYTPKACSKTITKKVPRSSLSSLLGKRSGFCSSPRPSITVQKNL